MPHFLTFGSTLKDVRSYIDETLQNEESLAAAEQRTAEHFGFLNWQQLRVFVAPPQNKVPDFLYLACLTYRPEENWRRQERARAMLEKNPILGSLDIYHACACGNLDAVRSFVDGDASLVNKCGGINGWEPLLYACYSRLNLPGKSTKAVAEYLLEEGADPNAHYMWGGSYRFTALTGVLGEGERGPKNQPRHAEEHALATLLLEAGANPNDCQALYNRMFEPGVECVELLFKYGLAKSHKNNWLEPDDSGELQPLGERTLDYQLKHAVNWNYADRARLLLEHGANPNQDLDESLLTLSTRHGNSELTELLKQHGASETGVSEVDRFIGLCVQQDEAGLRDLDIPALIQRTEKEQAETLANLASKNEADAVEFMIQLGFDVGMLGAQSPAHEAAYGGHVQLLRRLIEVHQANFNARDKRFNASVLGWAIHGEQDDAIAYLSTLDLSIFDLINLEDTDRIRTKIEANRTLLESTFGSQVEEDRQLPNGWQTPLAFAALNDKPESTQCLLALGGNREVADPEGVPLTKHVHRDAAAAIQDLFGK